MAVNRLDRLGRLSGIWLDMATRSQNEGMLGHPGAIRMILLHGESCNSSTTWPNMVDGGKVYAYHGRLSASTAVARGSGTGDTNRGNLLLNLMANKSILGQCHLLHIEWKTSGRRNHSGWSGLAWIACLLPRSAGLECVGLRVTCFLVHQVKILHSRGQVGPTPCLLSCLCMTLLWCCRLLQVLSCLSKGLGTLLKPERLL